MCASFFFSPCNFFSFDSPFAMLNFLNSPLGCTFEIGYFVQTDLKNANSLQGKPKKFTLQGENKKNITGEK
jgi:hypothetical protein